MGAIMTNIILGLIALLCFVGSSFASRTGNRSWVVKIWWVCFVIAFIAQCATIWRVVQSDREIKDLKVQVKNQDLWGVDENGNIFPKGRD